MQITLAHQLYWQSQFNFNFEFMESSSFEQRPIQLVHVTPEGKYQMHPNAQTFLRMVPKPIAVVSVAGLYRTGKSYLLNRILLNRNNGFGVGPTINPCTKGLWCWGTPLKGTSPDGEKINILIIDSEGIGALDEDQNHDIKIFTLAILTSSVFIYNSVGSIDQNALQNLSLVVNLTKNIQLNSQQNEDEDDPDQLAKYFPTFFWVVRDFSLQLISLEGEPITPKEYLQRALAPQKGFSDDTQEKNRIRRLLTAFFKQRQCATLVRPLVNQQKLQHLYDCSFQDLRPQFVEQALNLRKKVLTSSKPKIIKGECLDGPMYLSMLQSYLTAINNGSVPNIQNAWTYMCIEKCMKLQEECYDFFAFETQRVFEDNLPCPVDEFQRQIQNIEKQCLQRFQKQEIGQESKDYLLELKSKIKQKTNILRIQNQRQSINVLKNYIIKNFSVIEKKMKMNEFESYQDYLKSINSFYLYLVENGPDLPKKQIVYLDFLKKVISQGAEIFIKQLNQNLESTKMLSQEKEKILKQEAEELRKKLKIDTEKYREQIDSLNNDKNTSLRKTKQTQQKLQNLKASSKSEISKLETSYENKLKILQIKTGQLNLNLEDMKQKKQNLETSYLFEKKQRQKQKALTQLKINQLRDELKMLKMKEKNQQNMINQLTLENNNKLRDSSQEFEKKLGELTKELSKVRDISNDFSEKNEDLEEKLKVLEKQSQLSSKKLQDQLKAQIQKFQTYKSDVQASQSEQIKSLLSKNQVLQSSFKQQTQSKQLIQKQLKELTETFKITINSKDQQVAILTQKIQFLTSQALQSKQKYSRSLQQYDSMLKNQNQMQQQQLKKLYKQQISEIQNNYQQKIQKLQNSFTLLEEKNKQQTYTIQRMQETHKFNTQLQSKKYLSELNNKKAQIQTLQTEKNRLLNSTKSQLKQIQERMSKKQSYYQTKITQLQQELQIALQRAMSDHTELNNKSQQSLIQLKNYYELEKEKLQHRITTEKEKYQKKMNKLKEEYQTMMQQQRANLEEQNQNLRQQYSSQLSTLTELTRNLQHENDSKTKNLENAQLRYEEIKQRLDKKQGEYNNKIDSILKNSSQERESLQQKLMEMNQIKSKLEKQVLIIQHQKDQILKEFKEITDKYDSKVEELFYVNKNAEKIANENREKINELTNEYMNERLNYEKKIALNDQEKEFYCKKIEQYEKQHQKNTLNQDQLQKKLTVDFQQQLKALQQKKNSQYSLLQTKYQKLKKSSKDSQSYLTKSVNQLEKQVALQHEKYTNILQKYQELQQRRSSDSSYLMGQLNIAKENYSKANKELNQETLKLRRELNDLQNQKNRIQIEYDKDKILLENKNKYLEEKREENKKEFADKTKNFEQIIQNLQRKISNDKYYYENLIKQNDAKTQKKYTNLRQQNQQTWSKKQRQYQNTVKQLQSQLKNANQKLGNETQTMQDIIKTQQRKIRQLQENQKRIISDLQKSKYLRQSTNSESHSLYEKQKENMKQKLQQKQQKYRNLQKVKQQLYYNFQKQKARWNLQKENYLMKQDELKETISKCEKDLEKTNRQNQKLKAQKKCSKASGFSNFSRYSMERANSKYSLQDSINSINMSMSKENCSPLGQLSFFNNQ